jgi:hypothetical protein
MIMLQERKRLVFYCALVMGFLSTLACNLPTAPLSTSGTTSISEETPIPPTATPTETALNPSPLLEVFPLQIGTTWTYDYTADIAEGTEVRHYENPLTMTVTDVTNQDGYNIYHLQQEGNPGINTPEEEKLFYILLDGNLYQSYSLDQSAEIIASGGEDFEWNQILAWPLEAAQRWGEPEMLAREDGMYSWFVAGIESIETPAGTFDECYRLPATNTIIMAASTMKCGCCVSLSSAPRSGAAQQVYVQ